MRKPVKKVKRAATPRKASKKPAIQPLTNAQREDLIERRFAELEAALGAMVISSLQDGLEVRGAALTSTRDASWLVRTEGLRAEHGVELAMRVERGAEETPPTWALTALRTLARAAGGVATGQVLRVPGLFTGETDLDAVAFVPEPAFGVVQTAHDAVPVLLAVGITKDEARLVREWSPQALVETLAVAEPSLRTLPERPSLLSSPRARSAIEHRVSREGSSMGQWSARVSAASGSERVSWKLDVESADAVVSLLKGRIGHQRSFVVKSPSHEIELSPGDRPDVAVEGNRARLKLTQPFARLMRATLRPTPGTYVFPELPSLTIEVVA